MPESDTDPAEMLPTPPEYANLREVSEVYIQKAKEETDEELAIEFSFPSPISIWAFRIHIYEKDVPPEERKHWHYQGAQEEMKKGLGGS